MNKCSYCGKEMKSCVDAAHGEIFYVCPDEYCTSNVHWWFNDDDDE